MFPRILSAIILVLCLAGLSCTGTRPPASKNHALARQLNQAFVEVAERVSPTVVVIRTVQKISRDTDPEAEGNFDNLPPGFWRKFHEQFDTPRTLRGEGSGIIIRRDGFILTNRHVVEDAEKIEVRLQDGRSFNAAVRGLDPQSDVAVLKIQATNLPVAILADSNKVRVGEFAIAIGSPYSLEYSITFGHVSAKGRSNVILGTEGAGMDQDFLQTDANINPGNSGGPLVNIDGQVIGINTLIQGLRSGIGFAIPSSLARDISDQLITQGKFTRAWLGISIRALRDDPERKENLTEIQDGVIVSAILAGGPADKSDLKPDDIILSVDAHKVATPQQLRSEVRTKKIGLPVTLSVYRNGKILPVKVNPGEWQEPAPLPAPPRTPEPLTKKEAISGVEVADLSPELAKRFGFEGTNGIVVVGVKGITALENRFRLGDIILSLDQQPVTSVREFKDLAAKADLKKGAVLGLLRDKKERLEILRVEQPQDP